MKNRILSVLLLCLMVSVSFVTIPSLPSVKDKITTPADPVEHLTSVINPEHPQPTITNDDTWYSGETVKTDIEFNKQGIDRFNYMFGTWPNSYAGDRLEIGNIVYSLANDGTNMYLAYYPDSPPRAIGTTAGFACDLLIYCEGAGTLTYEMYAYWYESGTGTATTNTVSGTFSVTNNMLDNQGYFKIHAYVSMDNAGNYLYGYLQRETDTGYSTIALALKSAVTLTNFDGALMYFDQLHFTRDTITNYIHFDHQYTSPTTLIYRGIITSVPHAKELNVYYPEYMTYLSINPYASVTDSSSIVTVNSPTELTYTILFSSTYTNLLAVNDITATYFHDGSFEDGTYIDDLETTSSYLFDTVEVSTEQSFSGYSSLHIENTASGRGMLYFSSLGENRHTGFYLQVSCYFVSVSVGNLYIYHYNGTTWIYEGGAFDKTILNRWQTKLIYIDRFFGGSPNYLKIDSVSNFQGEAYIDNIRVFEANPKVKTVGVDQYLFSAQLRSIDGRQNPVIPSKKVFFKAFERNEGYSSGNTWDQYSFLDTYAYTNDNGIAEVRYNDSLEMKEYALMVYAEDSLFGMPENINYIASTGVISINDLNERETEIYGQITFIPAASYRYIWSIDFDDFRAIPYYMVHYEIKVNATEGSSEYIFSRSFFDTGGHHQAKKTFYEADTYYTVDTILNYQPSQYETNLNTGGTLIDNGYVRTNDFAYLQMMLFTSSAWEGEYINTIIKNLRIIVPQYTYFTPKYPNHIDYFETVEGDACDWSEGDSDSWLAYDLEAYSIENGEYIAESNCLTSSDGIRTLTEYPITTNFNQIYIRAKANRTQLMLYWINTDITAHAKYFTPTTEWQIFQIDLSTWIGETVTETRIISSSAGEPIKIEFDYVIFVHVDDPELFETSTNFYLSSSNNNYYYNIYFDENYLGVFTDLQTILKNNTIYSHNLTYILFSNGENQASIPQTYNYYYSVESESFTVSLQSFYLSDLYVNTYITSNYDGFYIVYEDSIPIGSGTLHKEGTTIISNRDVTPGASINYTIAFTSGSESVSFKTYYNNPSSDFFVTAYSVNIAATITVTWDTSKNTIDSLTIIEDGLEVVTSDTSSPSTWTKSTTAGTHHVTLIFSATDYNDILFSFVYVVSTPIVFSVNVENFYVTDDYVNLYVTSSYDYSYTVYENSTNIGSGSGLAQGSFIISPKNKEAGIYNFTVVFTNDTTDIIFMTWYSNLIPPPNPYNDFYREQSQGFYNITLLTNLDFYWIDIYHDNVLVVDDSNSTQFNIAKSLKVGWHNITFLYIYNCSTDSQGYPVAEYNVTLSNTFWYESVYFFESIIRYVPKDLGLAIGEFNVNWVLTYLDDELVRTADITTIEKYSNYSYISNYDIKIRNTMPEHLLTVKDLFGRLIVNQTIDLSNFTYTVIELPIYRLGVINLDEESHKLAIKPYQTEETYQYTPELPPGYFIEFWVHSGIYEFKLYNIVSTYYDHGVLIKVWGEDPSVMPPGWVPIVIQIPFSMDVDDDTAPEQSWLSENWIGVMILVIILIGGISLAIYYRRKK